MERGLGALTRNEDEVATVLPLSEPTPREPRVLRASKEAAGVLFH